jgi:prephenate dehydrogenase
LNSSARPFDTVAILGLGVMGGSLARGLAELSERPRVVGWSPSSEERETALGAGALDAAPADMRAAVRDADLVVLAAPLDASCALVTEVAAAAPQRATLSDVASLKAPLVRAAEEARVSQRWVGCHPMAGSEESGFAASRPGLYRGARVWTVATRAAASRVPAVHAFWRSLGASPAEIDAEEHDRLMALVSHLPQLTANALACVLMESKVRPEQLGPGGRDTTRLAGSSAELWRDLLAHASPELARGLRELSSTAGRIADMLERNDVDALADMMRATRTWRQS